MKIPLQEKIAELEARIAKLEEDASEHWGRSYEYRSISSESKGVFGKEWRKLWEQFDKVIKGAFGVVFLSLLLAVPLFGQTTHSAAISWGASPDAAANPGLGYNVYRLAAACPTSGTSGFTKVNSTPISALTFTDSGLGIGPVCYYVTATLNGAESVPSNTAGGTVEPSTVVIKVTVQ